MCCNDKFLADLKAINELFDILNKVFFESTLSKPVITIQRNKKAGVLGWFTLYEAWQAGEDKSPEINMSADYLDREPIDKASTLLHEMCHLYAFTKKIKDCSRSGIYHNSKFKEIAENHGFIVSKSKSGGWNVTTLKENAKNEIKPHLNDIQNIKRITESGNTKPSSTRKYICPECGLSVRATKEVNIICADCEELLIEEN